MAKEEDIEKLMQSMEFHLYMSQNEQSFFLEKFDDADLLVIYRSQIKCLGIKYNDEWLETNGKGAINKEDELLYFEEFDFRLFVNIRWTTFRQSS